MSLVIGPTIATTPLANQVFNCKARGLGILLIVFDEQLDPAAVNAPVSVAFLDRHLDGVASRNPQVRHPSGRAPQESDPNRFGLFASPKRDARQHRRDEAKREKTKNG
jgi:hypothetical protein